MKLEFVAVLSFVLSMKDIKNVLLNLMLRYRLHFPLKVLLGGGSGKDLQLDEVQQESIVFWHGDCVHLKLYKATIPS